MKYFKTAVTSIVLYVGHIAAINPQSAVCEASLYAGLSVLLPGVDLETPLQECLNDAQNYPALESCLANCTQCSQSENIVVCAASQDLCGLECAFLYPPPSWVIFFNDVVLDILALSCQLVDVYSLIITFLQCLFSSPVNN